MSNAQLARLPRFDSGSAGGLSLSEAKGATQPLESPPGILDESAPKPEVMVVPEAACAAELELAEVLRRLTAAIGEMRTASLRHTRESIMAIVDGLFPQLARLFLADEIARHLPALIPDAISAVEIRAAPALSRALQIASDRIAPLPPHVSILPDEGLLAGQVAVSWKTGGFDFDFDELLGKCLSQMNMSQRPNEDPEDGKG